MESIEERIRRVEAETESWPYYWAEAAELLRDHRAQLSDELAARLTRIVALNSPDPASLYMLLEPDGAGHASFYPDSTPPTPSTDDVISTFLDTYGKTTPEEEELLNRLIFNPTPDYGQMLARDEEQAMPMPGEAPKGSQDDLLNRFIISQKERQDPRPQDASSPQRPAIDAATVETRHSDREAVPAPAEDSLLSESLARVFIKQKQYDRAHEIISRLNLNFPEKSAYFADQLRFLEKLMRLQKLSKLKQ